jgi:hypothetical protein
VQQSQSRPKSHRDGAKRFVEIRLLRTNPERIAWSSKGLWQRGYPGVVGNATASTPQNGFSGGEVSEPVAPAGCSDQIGVQRSVMTTRKTFHGNRFFACAKAGQALRWIR